VSTQIQYRRGTGIQNDAFTGALGEVTVDTSNKTLRVHDGVAVGGSNIATVAYVSAQLSALSANKINQNASNVTVTASFVNVAVNGTNVAAFSSQSLSTTGFLNVSGNVLATGLSVFGNTRIGSLATPGALHTIIGNVDVSGAGTEYFNIGGNIMAIQASFGSINSTGFINTSGNIAASTLIGTLGTAAQTNITSVGTLTSLTVNGNVTIGGNLFVNGNVVTINANNLTVNDSMIHLADDNPADTLDIGFTAHVVNPTLTHVGFVRDASDSIWKLFSNVTTNPVTTVDFTGAIWAPLQVGNLRVTDTVTAIINAGTNGVGNIGATGATFNTVFAKATTAQYADLAEIYTSDQPYPAGTVVVFGGEAEVTQSHSPNDPRIAGVVSTNPAYLMNHDAVGVPVALQGRVPCRVLGPISKGDRVVSSHIAGVAQALVPTEYEPGCIIGKALQAIDSAEISVIEVVVGRV
jgi:hypothetical protein